jgi:hypothetical protein
MTHKTENWQEALLRVREGLKESNAPVEKTEDEVINEEIDVLLNAMEEPTEEVTEETEEVSEETQETEDNSVDLEKLSEKNMLGRLAKSMMLNEENKQKLFDYFESGELEQ